MAAAVASQAASFDLRTTSTYTISLGRSIQQTAQSSKIFGVQYNHKPKIEDPEDCTTSIVPSTTPEGGLVLSLKDGDNEYTYTGNQREEENTYVLIPDENGNGYSLEKLDSTFPFNLSSAPWDLHGNEYAQLDTKIHPIEEGNLFGDEDLVEAASDEEPEASNPFDFRHYIQPGDSPSPPALAPIRNAPAVPPPTAQQPKQIITPATRAVRKPTSAFAAPRQKPPKAAPKPQEPAQPQTSSKRVKLSPEAERTKPNVPAVRLDRRASTRIEPPPRRTAKDQAHHDSSDELNLDNNDDEGDLILEGDSAGKPNSQVRKQKSLGVALSGQLGEGPRSLRSAASSPASRVHSPAPPRPSPLGNVASDEDVEMEDVGGAAEQRREEGSEVDAEADGDAEDNEDIEDVDEFQLGSPAQTQRASITGTAVLADEDEEIDWERNLEMELEMELGAVEEDEVDKVRAESDEESEEE